MSEEISRETAFSAVAEKALHLIDEAIQATAPTDYAVIQKLAAALVDLHAALGLKKDQLDREEQHEKILKLRLATKEEAEKAGGGVILLPLVDGELQPPDDDLALAQLMRNQEAAEEDERFDLWLEETRQS